MNGASVRKVVERFVAKKTGTQAMPESVVIILARAPELSRISARPDAAMAGAAPTGGMPGTGEGGATGPWNMRVASPGADDEAPGRACAGAGAGIPMSALIFSSRVFPGTGGEDRRTRSCT